jgi:hypothetical protein
MNIQDWITAEIEKLHPLAQKDLNQYKEEVLPDLLTRYAASQVPENKGEISDGYHTFNELYDHRIALFIALCSVLQFHHKKSPIGMWALIWRSRLHSDGTVYPGWFIMGIGVTPGHQITYHLPMSKWEATEFADTLDLAPEFDGHTSADVIDRLIKNIPFHKINEQQP